MQKRLYIELLLLFVGIPIVLALPVYLIPKLLVGASGLLYVVILAVREKRSLVNTTLVIHWRHFLKILAFRFLVIAVVTYLIVAVYFPDELFKVVLTDPMKWLIILFVYSLLSVYPQELLYRPFFFKRYGTLFESKRMLILLNAVVFSIAHLFFESTLVLFITFIGGLIFAYTYYKTNSILLVCIEHALYGCWLFTVGMGGKLGFPS